MVSVRCAQLAADPRRKDTPEDGRRYRLAIAGLAAAWIAAVALVGPLLVEREIKASQSAAAAGQRDQTAGQSIEAENALASAVDHADTARSIEPWAASPYVQLGLLAELQGDYSGAATRFTQAIEREDRNWQWYYLRSKVEHEAGDEASALADLERARELNPIADCLQEGWNCG